MYYAIFRTHFMKNCLQNVPYMYNAKSWAEQSRGFVEKKNNNYFVKKARIFLKFFSRNVACEIINFVRNRTQKIWFFIQSLDLWLRGRRKKNCLIVADAHNFLKAKPRKIFPPLSVQFVYIANLYIHICNTFH